MNFDVEILDFSRFPAAAAALFLTVFLGALTGPLGGNANAFLWSVLDAMFGGIGDRLDKTHRSRADLVFRGFLLSALVLFFAGLSGYALAHLARTYDFIGLGEPAALTLLLAGGAVWVVLLRLYKTIENKKAGTGAYYALSRSTRKNLAAGDDFGVNRAALGFTARAFDKGVVAPLFWYVLAGLPAAFIYVCLAGLTWRFGKEGFGKGFGTVPLALEKLMGIVPSVLAAALLTLASVFTPGAGITRSLAAWAGTKGRAAYAEGGLPLSVMAWALNVSLGGAAQELTGSALKAAWTGPEGATAQIDHRHLKRALYMSLIAHLLFFTLLAGLYLWAGAVNPAINA